MRTVIETRDLSKAFPGGVRALEGVNLRIRPGSVYGLIGPNGAGKTTLLRLLMGLLRPERGSARVLEHELWEAPRAVRARVAYVAQAQQLHSWMTLEELCRYASQMYELWDADYAHDLASRWKLSRNHRIGTMSTGEQRKAALLLAFASRPSVLLLDEPAAGLDPITRRALVNEILDTLSAGEECTVLFSTHLLEDLERLVDHVGVMEAGHLRISSRLDDLQASIRRVQIVFPGETAPLGFFVPGAIWTESTGPVITSLVQLVNEAQLDPIRHLSGVRVQIFPLNLQEIFLALFGKSATPEREKSWDLTEHAEN